LNNAAPGSMNQSPLNSAAPKSTMLGRAPDADTLLELVLESLDDDQAIEVLPIALAGKSSLGDHMVIASGRSTRHVAAMAQKLAEKVKKSGYEARIEGLPNADWVLIDTGDVIVHLFRPEVRSFYNLERMWSFDTIDMREGELGDT
jgi:ribosome-associated protein